jgi:hypothetical protein
MGFATVSWPSPESGSERSILFFVRLGISSVERKLVELVIGPFCAENTRPSFLESGSFGVAGREREKEVRRGLGIGMPNIVFLRGFSRTSASIGGGISESGNFFSLTFFCVIVPFVAVDKGRDGDIAAGFEDTKGWK